jgi:hypothetical protein
MRVFAQQAGQRVVLPPSGQASRAHEAPIAQRDFANEHRAIRARLNGNARQQESVAGAANVRESRNCLGRWQIFHRIPHGAVGARKPQASVGDGDSLEIGLDGRAWAKIRGGGGEGKQLPQVEASMPRVLELAGASLRRPKPFNEKSLVVRQPQGVVHRSASGHAVRKPLAAGKRVVRAIELQAILRGGDGIWVPDGSWLARMDGVKISIIAGARPIRRT